MLNNFDFNIKIKYKMTSIICQHLVGLDISVTIKSLAEKWIENDMYKSIKSMGQLSVSYDDETTYNVFSPTISNIHQCISLSAFISVNDNNEVGRNVYCPHPCGGLFDAYFEKYDNRYTYMNKYNIAVFFKFDNNIPSQFNQLF